MAKTKSKNGKTNPKNETLEAEMKKAASKNADTESPDKEKDPVKEAIQEAAAELNKEKGNGKNKGSGAEGELSLEERISKAELAAREANEKYLRLMAEFDNFRKRTRKEKGDLLEYGGEDILKALLPVLDNFDRTMDAIGKTDNLSSIKDGIKLVTDSMHKTLKSKGLIEIDSTGEEFDSELHDAIGSFEVEEEKKGKVIETVEKGYKLKDKVIRYAKVIVGE